MVNGPWQFVVDSSKPARLFVVAPYHMSHIAYFWPGTDASMGDWETNMGGGGNFGQTVISANGPVNTYQQNVYELDFPDNTARQRGQAPNEENELVYQTSTNVLPITIQNVLYPKDTSIQRYAISLPTPDYVRTYSGSWVPGVAESKVAKSDPGPSTPFASYSTWTVLHYGFKNGKLPSQIKVQLNGTPSSPIPAVGQSDGIVRYGISIALMAAPLCPAGGYYPMCNFPQPPLHWSDDPECDSLSGLSSGLAAQMWGLVEYARFPIEKDTNGNQESGNYDYGCPAASKATLDEVKKRIAAIANLRNALSTLDNLLGINLQYRTSMSQRTTKQGDESTLTTTFEKISGDLTTIFDKRVPDMVGDDFYCACTAENQRSKVCQLPGVSPHTCDTNKGAAAYGEWLENDLERFTGGDKGSSDCHAAQISINGAIQP